MSFGRDGGPVLLYIEPIWLSIPAAVVAGATQAKC